MTSTAKDELRPLAVRGRPRLKAYVSESRGVHRLADLGEGVAGGLHAWQLLMTGTGCFTGLTSAQIRGWWLPPVPAASPVFMAMGLGDPRPMRTGVLTSRHTREIAFEVIAGLRCATVAETVLACARWLCQTDLVVIIDGVLHLGLATCGELEDVARPRRPGAHSLRRALELADGRSESAYETMLRMLHVSCGIDVLPQFEVLDPEGVLVARCDLWLRGTNACHEYDGDEHEKAPRRVKDRRRDRRLDKAGFLRRGYTAGDVLRRPVTILEDADRSLGRAHDPTRIRPWNAQLKESLFTPAGQATFLRRVARHGGG